MDEESATAAAQKVVCYLADDQCNVDGKSRLTRSALKLDILCRLTLAVRAL